MRILDLCSPVARWGQNGGNVLEGGGAETNNGDGRKFVPMSFIIIFTIFYFYEQKIQA